MEKTVTVKLPASLYELSEKMLIDTGFFSDFEDVVRTAVRVLILNWSDLGKEVEPPGLSDAERCAYYLDRLRAKITAAGGLFPGKTSDEIIEILRQTRERIIEEKYAAHFGLE